jgi:hypothetical protein
MSTFGAKRKARVVQTFDDGEGPEEQSSIGPGRPDNSREYNTFPANKPVADPEKPADTSATESNSDVLGLKFTRKPFKQSSLRRSVNASDEEVSAQSGLDAPEDDDGGATSVVRPSASRLGSSKQRSRVASKLSFGLTQAADQDGEADNSPVAAVKRPAAKPSPLSRLPVRSFDTDDQPTKPKYSADYLAELQSSTPNAPQDLSSLQRASDEDESLDPSELAGAVIVPSTELATTAAGRAARLPTILTETEIQARKARRARAALDQGADDAVEDDGRDGSDGDGVGAGEHYIALTEHAETKKKKGERLIAEDEDLGEGYDEFVEDGGLQLGRKAERAAEQRRRAEMAALIQAAEGKDTATGEEDADDGSEDSSDAERKAAYEAAQTRAGMDGLLRPEEKLLHGNGDSDGIAGVPRMKPLPDLQKSLAKVQSIVQEMQDDVAHKQARIAELGKEKAEILAREIEVQELLNAMGQKFQPAANGAAADAMPSVDAALSTQSPLRAIPVGLRADLPVERGLESFGNTPLRQEADPDE